MFTACSYSHSFVMGISNIKRSNSHGFIKGKKISKKRKFFSLKSQ